MENLIETLPKDYLKTIFWKAPNPMSISTAKEGIYIDVNEAFTKFFGLRRKDVNRDTSENYSCQCHSVYKDKISKEVKSEDSFSA